MTLAARGVLSFGEETMRIVHILTRLLRAGSEENTLLTSAGQIARGHEVFLIHGHEVMPEHALRLAPGATLIAVPELTREVDPARDIAAWRAIRRWLSVLQPDVVHTHQSKAGVLGRLAAAVARVPAIIHGVHILPFLGEKGAKRAAYLLLEHATARTTHAYLHVSEGMREACLTQGIGRQSAHYVVRSGFDLARFANAEPPDEWRRILRLRPGEGRPPVIAMLASLEPRKRPLELLDHVPALLSRLPGARLVLAGEGHLRAEVEERIRRLGLEGSVALLGFRDDPERIIALADVCVHCAEREGLPRSVLQYLASGRPTVMFHLPGIEEVIASGSNGIVVPQRDWAALGTALVAVAGDDSARARLAAGARATDLGRWSVTSMAEQTLSAYQDVLHGRSHPPRDRLAGLATTAGSRI